MERPLATRPARASPAARLHLVGRPGFLFCTGWIYRVGEDLPRAPVRKVRRGAIQRWRMLPTPVAAWRELHGPGRCSGYPAPDQEDGPRIGKTNWISLYRETEEQAKTSSVLSGDATYFFLWKLYSFGGVLAKVRRFYLRHPHEAAYATLPPA